VRFISNDQKDKANIEAEQIKNYKNLSNDQVIKIINYYKWNE
jgi:uncharacterized protein (DUF433 family)